MKAKVIGRVIVPGTVLILESACNSWSALWREHAREIRRRNHERNSCPKAGGEAR